MNELTQEQLDEIRARQVNETVSHRETRAFQCHQDRADLLGHAKAQQAKLDAAERAILKYKYAEGCDCCRDTEEHKVAEEELAEIFDWKPFSDGSGVDWYSRRDELLKR